jgi:hypothetical protein
MALSRKKYERINRTGEAKILTVNGEARAVLVPPAVYDVMAKETMLAYDVAAIRQSMKEIDEGQCMTVDELHSHLRSTLLAIKTSQGVKE